MERAIITTEPTIEEVQNILNEEIRAMKVADGVENVYAECLFYLSHDLYLWVLKQPDDTFGYGFLTNISGDVLLYGIPARLDMNWDSNVWGGSLQHTYPGKCRGEDHWHISKGFHLLDNADDINIVQSLG